MSCLTTVTENWVFEKATFFVEIINKHNNLIRVDRVVVNIDISVVRNY